MDEKIEKNSEFAEVNMKRILDALLQKAWIIALVSVVCAILILSITYFFITPQYQAKAMFYVNNSSISVGNSSLSISSGDLVTSRNLVDSYIVILKSRETLISVIDYAGVGRTYAQLKGMISAAAVNETEIFEVVVTSPDPYEAERIANAVAYILPKRINSIIEGTSAKIVDAAVVPTSPSSPSFVTNTLMGFLLGFVMTAGLIVLKEIFDVTIRREEDVAQISKLPILASVPDMMSPTKSGYYYGKSGNKKKTPQKTFRDTDMIGDEIPFAAAEAYKLLRTKVQFSFADDSNCHVIGVSSALSGEGKSTTSVNLAHALAQLNRKVLLVDCDLRRPSVAAKLRIKQEHGLSSYLTKQSAIEEVVQEYTFKHGVTFTVVPAGPVPPNPTELLNSSRMARFMERYARNFDYVILDLPPVEEVSDALVAAKLADGVLLAVRQDYCNRVALEDTIRQFEFVNGRILGLLMTCARDHGAGYGYSKYYYRRYYHRYGRYYHYARSYEESYMENKKKTEKSK